MDITIQYSLINGLSDHDAQIFKLTHFSSLTPERFAFF